MSEQGRSCSPQRRYRWSRSTSRSRSHSASLKHIHHHHYHHRHYEHKRRHDEGAEMQKLKNRNDVAYRSRMWTVVNSDKDDSSTGKTHKDSSIDSKYSHDSYHHTSKGRLRSLSSSSESESSDILKSERSRHKSKHKYKKSHEDKKRHKKKEKQRKKDSKSKKYAVNQDKYGKYGILRESDFHYKSVSFQAWLRDVKKMGEFNGPKWEAMELFKEYMEDYNTCTMPHKKYYDIEKYEMKRYQKKQRKAFANQKETSGKTLDTLADEERLHRELRNAREKKEQEEFRLVLQLMDKDKIEAMREQERIRAQMQLLYKSGNVEEARRLEQILNKVEEDPRFKR